jgi:drug/metabolite transporter (DMT)-like permease
VLTLLSAAVFSLYSVIGKAKSAQYSVAVLSCFTFFMGGFEMLLLIMLSHHQVVSAFLTSKGLSVFADISLTQGMTWVNIPDLIYISVCVTGLGFMLYFLALQETSSAIGAVVFYIKPALAPVFAMVLLHETIAFNVWVGIFFILIGSTITLFYNVKQTKICN